MKVNFLNILGKKGKNFNNGNYQGNKILKFFEKIKFLKI